MNTIFTKLTRHSRCEIKHRTLALMAVELVDQIVNPHLQWARKELLRFVFKRQLPVIVFIQRGDRLQEVSLELVEGLLSSLTTEKNILTTYSIFNSDRGVE